jgi:uncharacterized protein YhfF
MSEEASRVYEFGIAGPLRDRLVAAVLRGEKTAGSSLLLEYQLEDEPLPKVGERRKVLDSAGAPVGVVEIISVEVISLADADLTLALEEGEGFSDVGEWRAEHERFWSEEVIPQLPPGSASPLADDTEVVVERFRLVE